MKFFLLSVLSTISIFLFIQSGFCQDNQNDPTSKIIQNISRIESLYFKNLSTLDRQEAVKLVNETRSLIMENQVSKEIKTAQKDINILSEEGFKSLLDSVKDENSDASRTKIILSIGKKGRITSAQVAQLVALYKYDPEREKLIKSISDNIIDPVNIGVALKYFDSSRSRENLAEYFRNKE
jgi:hypothetical protein